MTATKKMILYFEMVSRILILFTTFLYTPTIVDITVAAKRTAISQTFSYGITVVSVAQKTTPLKQKIEPFTELYIPLASTLTAHLFQPAFTYADFCSEIIRAVLSLNTARAPPLA